MDCKNVCRFCFRTVDNVFPVDNMTREILDLLLLKVDLVTEPPVMCHECASTLQKAFEFKSACIYTEDCIFPFSNSKNDCKLNLQEIYLKINENENGDCIEDQQVCRFCMTLVKNDYCTRINDVVRNTPPIKKLLDEYFPEIDLTSVEEPVICEACLGFLHVYLVFITVQSNAEANIKHYIKAVGNNDGTEVNLGGVQELLLNSAIKNVVCTKDADPFAEQAVSNTIENKVLHEIKDEHFTEIQSLQFDVKNEEPTIEFEKVDCKTVESFGEVSKQNDTSDDKNINQNLNVNPEKVVVKRKRFKCKSCSYRTKSRKLFKQHLLTHKDIWKCLLCNYKAKRERLLKQHMRVHRDPSEITMFKCEQCEYVAKRKRSLRHHMQIHESQSELPVLDCPLCTYTTNCRKNINDHMSNHKNSSGMYECVSCLYKTKSGCTIRKHILTHGEPIKCELCSFQTKYKNILAQHMISHMPSSDVQLYECDRCTFKTYSKSSMRDHKRRRHDPTSTMFRTCNVCDYVTKYPGHLTQHMLSHKDPSQVTVYKCELCPHETKYKGNFNKHMNRHTEVKEKDVLKDEICACKLESNSGFYEDVSSHRE